MLDYIKINNKKFLKFYNCDQFYLINLARTFAAICVVLQHYQHFFFVGPNSYQDSFVRAGQPFYEIIKPLYLFGGVSVQFFFVLSGFIFFLIYKDKIYSKNINFKKFFILRFSRLYPLHILTLFLVLILQYYHEYLNGEFFVHTANNFKNFILHLFLIQQWGFTMPWAFNAASWSISVELLLYLTFYFLVKKIIKNIFRTSIILILIFILNILIQPFLSHVIVGFLCFYTGGITYFVYKKLCIIIKINQLNAFYVIALLALIDFIVFGKFLNFYFLDIQKNFELLIGERIFLLLFFVKFPLIILNLSLLQNFYKDLGKSLKIIGEISYTIYLVHFPIEIIFSLINKNLISLDFKNNFVFLTYLISIILTSIFIFKFFEQPAKNLIRSKFL